MKLAIIDHNWATSLEIESLRDFLRLRRVEFDEEISLYEFEFTYGSLDKYDGILMHLGPENGKNAQAVVSKYPTKKVALFAANVDEYRGSDLPVFNALNVDAIVEYFSEKKE